MLTAHAGILEMAVLHLLDPQTRKLPSACHRMAEEEATSVEEAEVAAKTGRQTEAEDVRRMMIAMIVTRVAALRKGAGANATTVTATTDTLKTTCTVIQEMIAIAPISSEAGRTLEALTLAIRLRSQEKFPRHRWPPPHRPSGQCPAEVLSQTTRIAQHRLAHQSLRTRRISLPTEYRAQTQTDSINQRRRL